MTMLEKAINGRKIISRVDGQNTPYDKRSNIYKSIVANGYTLDDLESGKIDIAVGAHKRTYSEGFKMALVEN